MKLNGSIITGDFDQSNNEFMLEKVKHFSTESTLKETQLNNLYDFLYKNKDDSDGLVLTLYDKMLIRLNQEEINQFIQDLNNIRTFYQ
ncbi:hypothetical protein [Pseudalkalibacillus salsuginis]|uniref:hypothetical protein n=1 Tax=Pseudalkalibacillus salsuginis TaxID=2910972 RepID=UPI001F3E55E7|nr:hypothetical protein [Pseudalkalibacillus salsuginis]MCF6408805.1 hypothetical protein [Pseudalkalibacillus salsuginis]